MLALWLDARLLLLLLVNWTYLGLMSREFFAREWLKRRPITYLWTHMLIMPLIDFYATACDWLPADGSPPRGLFWFVIVSFFNGVVIEIGRKIRAPEKEETGVPTYSALWGGPKAATVWLTIMAITAASAIFASGLIHFRGPVAITLFTMLVIATILVISFSRTEAVRYGRWFENLSGIWTIILYLILGAIPLLVKLRTSG
jgi:4-hydroxybenzoate polyprenyltransferase